MGGMVKTQKSLNLQAINLAQEWGLDSCQEKQSQIFTEIVV